MSAIAENCAAVALDLEAGLKAAGAGRVHEDAGG